MESIFTRLQSYSPRDKRTPEEDFFTEVFVGVMERHPEALAFLLKQLFKVPDINPDSLRIRAQVSYESARPDIEIKGKNLEGQNIVIFIESKINAVEDEGQLKKYVKQLADSFSNCKCFLFFITCYSEEKDESTIIEGHEVVFKQYRWHTIYKDI